MDGEEEWCELCCERKKGQWFNDAAIGRNRGRCSYGYSEFEEFFVFFCWEEMK